MAVAEDQSSLRTDAGGIDESVHGIDSLTLPGFGQAGDDCGEWRVDGFCDAPTREDGEASHVTLGVHQCGRRGCPDCWMRWARERTVSSVVRLGAAAEVEDAGLDRRTVHATISPPEGAVESVSEFYRYRSKAVEKAREAGIRGGLVVPHAFRVSRRRKALFRILQADDLDDVVPDREDDETGELAVSLLSSGDSLAVELLHRTWDGGGIWNWVRENDTPWREQVVWGPHFHVIGLAREVEPVGDGWVARRLSTLDEWDRNDRDAYDSRAAAVRYLLSHTTYPEEENRQVVTWFGSLHGTNFDPEEELTLTVFRRIEELAEEVVGEENPDDGEEGEEEDEEECPVEGCPGHVHPIHELEDFLDQNRVPTLNEMVLRTSLRWARGDIDPPPGMHGPESFGDAREALTEMVRREYAGTSRFEQVRRERGSASVIAEETREMLSQ